ncbi:hypothetical protein RJT34_26800 [Clitoria ternatea]|uniref:Uncharacterized protein n=1 Tax=Clitoria ternatea TaxID=43366 RepID=A0AAN9F9B9_CLITE
MESTFPYDCDVEVIASMVRCYGDLPRPPTVDELDELTERRDALIAELIATTVPMKIVSTTSYVTLSPMTKFLARVEWDHLESFLRHVYRSFTYGDIEDITAMSLTTRDLLVLVSDAYHRHGLRGQRPLMLG